MRHTPHSGRASSPVVFRRRRIMYESPRLERFGTFRELTQAGRSSGWDLYGVLLDDDVGCTENGGIYDAEIGCNYSRS